jgi:hypothetical protein
VLLSIAAEGAFRPVWQSKILEETSRNIVRLRVKAGVDAAVAAADAAHTLSQMANAFPDGSLDDVEWEPHVASMTNEAKDRHVLAAAVGAGATHLVTSNTPDFPKKSIPEGIVVMTPNSFLCKLLDDDPEAAISAIEKMSARLEKPPQSPMDLAEHMAKGQHAVQFGQRLLVLLSI